MSETDKKAETDAHTHMPNVMSETDKKDEAGPYYKRCVIFWFKWSIIDN